MTKSLPHTLKTASRSWNAADHLASSQSNQHRDPPRPDCLTCNENELAHLHLNYQGMIVDEEQPAGTASVDTPNGNHVGTNEKKRRKRQPRIYVSRHFTPTPPVEETTSKSTGKRSSKRKRQNGIRKGETEDLSNIHTSDRNAEIIPAPNVQEVTAKGQNNFLKDKDHEHIEDNCTGDAMQSGNTEFEAAAGTKRSAAATKKAGLPKKPRKRTKRQHRGKDRASSSSQEPLAEAIESPNAQQLSPNMSTIPRIYFGLNIDELSSDSDLTDVPEDIGPDPFISSTAAAAAAAELVAVKQPITKKKKVKRNSPTKSPYFLPHKHKYRATFLSTLPFPPLDHTRFGLMQERLAEEPFKLLLATIFLNKTPGARAMPVFFRLLDVYPDPETLAAADPKDITPIIHELGFQNQRAAKCVAFAKGWLAHPPLRGRRSRKKDYPFKGAGRALKDGQTYEDELDGGPDAGEAWEISHLPGIGPYSHDSWRIFCRDKMRGLAESWDGQGHAVSSTSSVKNGVNVGGDCDGDGDFEPEWQRVVPTDKELRAYLTWMWLKKGWLWNKETGERTRASDELMRLARGEGNVVIEEREREMLMIKPLQGDVDDEAVATTKLDREVVDVKIEKPAGDFMPEKTR